MKITFDERKRRLTLTKRSLDFADAAEVFAGDHFDILDERLDYGEIRVITFGWLQDRAVAIVWTERNGTRRIISMRHVHGKELENRRRALD